MEPNKVSGRQIGSQSGGFIPHIASGQQREAIARLSQLTVCRQVGRGGFAVECQPWAVHHQLGQGIGCRQRQDLCLFSLPELTEKQKCRLDGQHLPLRPEHGRIDNPFPGALPAPFGVGLQSRETVERRTCHGKQYPPGAQMNCGGGSGRRHLPDKQGIVRNVIPAGFNQPQNGTRFATPRWTGEHVPFPGLDTGSTVQLKPAKPPEQKQQDESQI